MNKYKNAERPLRVLSLIRIATALSTLCFVVQHEPDGADAIAMSPRTTTTVTTDYVPPCDRQPHITSANAEQVIFAEPNSENPTSACLAELGEYCDENEFISNGSRVCLAFDGATVGQTANGVQVAYVPVSVEGGSEFYAVVLDQADTNGDGILEFTRTFEECTALLDRFRTTATTIASILPVLQNVVINVNGMQTGCLENPEELLAPVPAIEN